MRVCFDTNVLISGAALPNSMPGRLIAAVLSGNLTLICSEWQIAEFARVSRYPRVKKFLKPTRAGALVNRLRELAIFVIPRPIPDVSPDPDDNMIIATALAGDAQFLISGDENHVLSVQKVQHLRIIGVREAIKAFGLKPQSS
jgi:uncharacterized protein